ncbi:MAG: hypothetical protein D6742_16040 [Cyanobacteria bacterium J069]|nr:MAG: hypothetical protein D6742_16040 [Cyanobacteria bacterium J069]
MLKNTLPLRQFLNQAIVMLVLAFALAFALALAIARPVISRPPNRFEATTSRQPYRGNHSPLI